MDISPRGQTAYIARLEFVTAKAKLNVARGVLWVNKQIKQS